MSKNLSTYVTFPGNAAEVFEHWAKIFDGDLTMMKYEEMSTEGFPFQPDPERVAHAQLKLAGGTITGGDNMPGSPEAPLQDTAYSLLYSLDTPEEAERLIKGLVDGGGQLAMPFEEAPWGGFYGQAMDRFGVLWAFDVEAPGPTVEDTKI